MYFSKNYTSKLGEMQILSDGKNIRGLHFIGQKHFPKNLKTDHHDLAIFDRVTNWLDDYFNGLNPKINFKIAPDGTDFQLKVWGMLSEIPYGNVVSYGEIASKISKTMSAQAVGGAVGKNPIAIIIPCHRVIGSDGNLTGYAAGLDKKVELLKLEGYIK